VQKAVEEFFICYSEKKRKEKKTKIIKDSILIVAKLEIKRKVKIILKRILLR